MTPEKLRKCGVGFEKEAFKNKLCSYFTAQERPPFVFESLNDD